MSRGKKAKRKIGGRKKQESSVVSENLRLTNVEASSVIPINKSHTLELNPKTSSKSVKSLRSKSVETGERCEKLIPIPESKEFEEKSDSNVSETRTNGRNFAILFKNEELQKLKNILRRSDLSKTPLLLGAIILGKVDVVKRLLRDGYPINSRSEEDKTTALMWAVRRKDLEMINLLVRNGADLTLLDENNDNVALIAVQSSSWEQNDFLDFWNSIDCKIDLKHENIRGYTILHYARERQWNVLAKLIDKSSTFLKSIDTIAKNPCFCCYCSSATESTRYRFKQVLTPEYTESTLLHLSVLFEEIVNRYRDAWLRDRDLGYPDFRGGQGDTATTFDELSSLRREEIARLNTVLPKLEESYLQKLRDCWTSLDTKMRETALKDPKKFEEFVTSIQIQLLTHRISPVGNENVSFYSDERITDRQRVEHVEFSEPGSSSRRIDEESLFRSRNYDIRPRVSLDS